MIKLGQFDLKHMDVASRNQRLRETLEGMGLFVQPVASTNSDTIDYLIVATALPTFVQQGAKNAASGAVTAPMTRTEIVGALGAADATRDVVVDFPTKLR